MTQLTALQEASKRGDDIFEEAVTTAIAYGEGLDNGRWVIGEIATMLGTRYGEDIIGKFAYAIKYRPSTVREYRGMFEFWGDARDEVMDRYADCNWTMMREAKRSGNLVEALELLEEAALNNWDAVAIAAELKRRRKKPQRRKLLEIETDEWALDEQGLILRLGEEARDVLKEYETVKIVIWSLPEIQHD